VTKKTTEGAEPPGAIGIVSYGAHVPRLRVKCAEIAAAWRSHSPRGERAVANFDEDSITMAVAAGVDCLRDGDRDAVDGLYFACTTSPFEEKQASSLIAGALNLRSDIHTADFAHSLRTATQAFIAAADAVRSGRCRTVLVIASDCRQAAPGSDLELRLGDAAAAFLIGSGSGAARLVADTSLNSEFIGVWRTAGEPFVKSWEERFVIQEGYTRDILKVVEALFAKSGLQARDIAQAAIYGPDPRSQAGVLKKLGLGKLVLGKTAETSALLFERVGNAGAAFAPLMLVAALDAAAPGQKILFVSQGDGADAFVFEVGDPPAPARRRGLERQIARASYIATYALYLNTRSLLERDPQRLPEDPALLPAWWRDHDQSLGLNGQKCRVCGMVQFPKQRVCSGCQARDSGEDYPLAGRTGKIFTFTHDYLVAAADPPTATAFIDFEDGGRIFCELTDTDSAAAAIGMPVEATFRLIHKSGGLPHYSWKCRQIVREDQP
jgi:3-hydroxy-3-methylglutaryl CoA synthase